MNDKKLTSALLSGLAGAAALTVLHETVRRVRSDAPRMDTLGRRAIAKGLEAAGLETPPEDQLQAVALGGDIVANTLYYSLACLGKPSLAQPPDWVRWSWLRSWGWAAAPAPASPRRPR